MRHVLLTGSTGFIGSYVLRHLLARNCRVRIPVRSRRKLDPRTAPRVDILDGDLRDPSTIRRAVAGVDTVIHLAAYAAAWARDPRVFHDVNVGVVERLLEASARENVDRLVHVSSILTQAPFRKSGIQGRAGGLTPYERTKMAADEALREYARGGKHAVIVRPTRVFGPGPMNDANGVTRMIDLYLKGRFRFRLDDDNVLANYVHADDVARGILLASEAGKAGREYILGGENISLQGFLDLVSDLTGVRRRVFTIPPEAGLLVARLTELSAHLGRAPSLTPGWVRVFLEDRRASIQPARNDLGYRPRSLRDGLAETLAWLRGPTHPHLGTTEVPERERTSS